MGSALIKDIVRQIVKNPRRFIAILAIVALAVAVFAGLRATGPDMEHTLNSYFDAQRMYDIQVVSTYGLNEDDIGAIRRTPGVGHVMPAYSLDALFGENDGQVTVKLQSVDTDAVHADAGDALGRPLLLEGRLPAGVGECVVDQALVGDTGAKVGDTIDLRSGKTDTDLSDALEATSPRIVGIARSPVYISHDRGSSTINSGTVDGFVLLPVKAFTMSVYTEAYVTAAGAAGLSRSSDTYKDAVQAVADALEGTAGVRTAARFDEIKAEAEETLEDARRQLTEGEQALTDAKKKLDDAQKEFNEGEAEYQQNKDLFDREISAAEQKLASARAQITASEAEIARNRARLSDGREQAAAAKAQLQAAAREIADGEARLIMLGQQIAGAEAQLALLPPGSSDAAVLAQSIAAMRGAYAEAEAGLAQGKAEYESGLMAYHAESAKLDAGEKALLEGEQKLAEGKRTLAQGEREFDRQKAEGASKLRDARAQLDEASTKLQDGRKQYEKESLEAEPKLRDARRHIADGEAQLASLGMPVWYALDLNFNQGFSSFSQDVKRIAAIGDTFPLIFFIVAIFVTLTTMTRAVEDDRQNIGTYKALGYGDAAIVAKYLSYAFFACLLGSAAGISFGLFLFPGVIFNAYRGLYNLSGVLYSFNTLSTLLSVTAAVACAVVPTAIVCAAEMLHTPSSLLRPKSPKKGKRIFLEYIPFVWNHINFSNKVAARNIFRYKKRLLMTVIGVAGCTALIYCGFGILTAVIGALPKQFDTIHTYDMSLEIGSGVTETRCEAIRDELGRNPQIADVSPLHMQWADLSSPGDTRTARLTVLMDSENVGDFIRLHERVSGAPLTPDDETVILTEKLASLLKVGVGDTIRLKDADNRLFDVEIGGVTENYFLHYVYVSPSFYRSLYGFDATANTLLARFEDSGSVDEKALSADLMKREGVTSVSVTSDFRDAMDDTLQALRMVVAVIILVAAALAFVVLYSLTNINIDERQRELATIKVLGFFDGETAMYVFREGMVLTVMGMIAGLLLGVPLAEYILRTVEVDMVMFTRDLAPLNFVYAALLTIAFALFVDLTMLGTVRKIDMVQSLKSVE